MADAQDWALDAILALRATWDAKGGAVTLADLGLDARLRTLLLTAVCHRHRMFVSERTLLIDELIPAELECPMAGLDGTPCGRRARVFTVDLATAR